MRDLRFAARNLRRNPGFTATVAAVLALGIGTNTAIFSLVDQILLHPAGVDHPERVVALRVRYPKLNLPNIGISARDFADARESRSVFRNAAAVGQGDFNYTGAAVPERLQGASVTAEWFDVFGARPLLGRTFLPEEDEPNNNQVVVLSYAAWKRLFGGDPTVIGRSMELNYKPHRITGVMRPGFRWPRQADLWVPLGLDRKAWAEENRFNENMAGFARLQPGVTLQQAQTQMGVLSDRVRTGTQNGAFARSSEWGMFVMPVAEFSAGETKKPLLILVGAVGFVLLIACANIAGLLLARASGRARDAAVRVALGAGRWRLVRETMIESLLLAVLGGAGGIVMASVAANLMLMLAPENAAPGVEAALSVPVLAFSAMLSVLTGLAFGLAPAWRIARMDPHENLKGGGRTGSPTAARQRLRSVLVIGEVAIALVLLVGAGLFLRSMARLQAVDPGFHPEGVVTATLSLPKARYATKAQQAAFFHAVEDKLAGSPGVIAAAHALPMPFSGDDWTASFRIQGRPVAPGDPGPHGRVRAVSGNFFTALGIPLRAGRLFTAGDREGSAPVAIIDENLAREYWPGEDPLGKALRNDDNGPWYVIVGVVGNIHHTDLASDSGKGTYYFSIYQKPTPLDTIVVKTAGDSAAMAGVIREAVRSVDPTQPVHSVITMSDWIEKSLAPRRFVQRLLVFFAAMALFLAAFGLYGVISYSVTQRTQEIGIRMALGADRGDVLGMVVGQGLRLAVAGAVIGLGGSLAAFALLRSVLYRAGAFDVVTFASTCGVLLAAAALASYLPALRATRVSPAEALRYE